MGPVQTLARRRGRAGVRGARKINRGTRHPRTPLRRGRGRRCWCSAASTATSRRASRRCIELASRLGAGPRRRAPVWLLPAVNPDGVARGRKNSARDVDLNRNFPARSFVTAHAPGYFPGPAPLSEPETRVIADLLAREPIAAVVAVHAPFACVNYDGPAAAWAEAVAAACGWPARADIGYPTPGSLGSWLGHRSRPAGADPGAAPRAAGGVSEPRRRRPWTNRYAPHRCDEWTAV